MFCFVYLKNTKINEWEEVNTAEKKSFKEDKSVLLYVTSETDVHIFKAIIINLLNIFLSIMKCSEFLLPSV